MGDGNKTRMVRRLDRSAVDYLRPAGKLRLAAIARQEDPERPVVTFYHACGHVSETDYSKVRPVSKRMTAMGVRLTLRGDRWWVGQGINAPCPTCGHGGRRPPRTIGTRQAGTWVLE